MTHGCKTWAGWLNFVCSVPSTWGKRDAELQKRMPLQRLYRPFSQKEQERQLMPASMATRCPTFKVVTPGAMAVTIPEAS